MGTRNRRTAKKPTTTRNRRTTKNRRQQEIDGRQKNRRQQEIDGRQKNRRQERSMQMHEGTQTSVRLGWEHVQQCVPRQMRRCQKLKKRQGPVHIHRLHRQGEKESMHHNRQTAKGRLVGHTKNDKKIVGRICEDDTQKKLATEQERKEKASKGCQCCQEKGRRRQEKDCLCRQEEGRRCQEEGCG